MVYVFYHAKCFDGFGAAYAAWKFFGDDAKYIPVNYDKKNVISDEIEDGSEVYTCDFCFSAEVLLKLAAKCEAVYVLDHHKTAQEDLKALGPEIPKNLYITFDMNRSGALITWEHFHGVGTAPLLIEHISDRDLWTFEYEDTEAIHLALVSQPMNFERWDAFEIEKLKKEGETLKRMHNQLVKRICSTAFFRDIGGHEVPVVNTSIAWSEVGNKLVDLYPNSPFAASFTIMEDHVMWSLRSKAGEDSFDVSEVARQFGGGGHRNAAGFRTARF